MFRKKTFTGQALNFLSLVPLNFKLNSCKTLIFRAYNLCSNYVLFNNEIQFLYNFFKNNNYPSFLFDNSVRKFLYNIYSPRPITYSVPKQKSYFSIPYLGELSDSFTRELKSILSKSHPQLDLRLSFNNPQKIGSFFKYKDPLPRLLRSNVVYLFTCPKCNLGKYVGCTQRMLKVRIDSHNGISYRTGKELCKKEHSSIRSHCENHNYGATYEDFQILAQTKESSNLNIVESLFIKEIRPNLNIDQSSLPLLVA